MICKIQGFENYTISDAGVVTNTFTGKTKKPTSNHSGNGYLYVDLYKWGSKHRVYIHRLVAKHFISNLDHKPYVNHKNGDTKDNRVDNLEWVTAKENVTHASNVLHVMKGYENANKKRQRKVQMYDYATMKPLKVFESIRQAERETGINSSYITQICQGKFKQCKGTTWCYVEEQDNE